MPLRMVLLVLSVCVAAPAFAKPPTSRQIRTYIDELAASETRTAAANKLVAAGAVAIKPLSKALREDKRKDVRLHSAHCLRRLKANSAIPSLVLAQGDRFVTVREAAAKALVAAGTPTKKMVKVLAQLLSHEADAVVYMAGKQLAKLKGDAFPAGKALVARLDQKFERSETMLQLLATLTSMGRKGLPHLILALDSKKADIRLRMLDAIRAMKKDGAAAVPRLQKLLSKDKSAKVRGRAVDTIAAVGSPKVVRAALVPRLTDKKDDVRRAAAEELGKLGAEEGRRAVPGLVRALAKDESTAVRVAAARALGEIGQPAEKLVKPLFACVGKKGALRNAALKSLGQLGEPAAASLIKVADKTKETDFRLAVMRILGVKIKQPADEIARCLVDRLSDGEITVRNQAVTSLAALGKPAVGRLQTMLESEDRELKLLAIRTLGNLGPAAEPAVQALIDLTGELDPDFKNGARAALKKIAKKSKGALKSKIEAALAD